MFEKMKLYLNKKADKLNKAFAPAVAAGAAMGLVPTVYADEESTLDTTMGEILNVVFTLFRYIGVVLALWGVGSLVMAFKNEDADSKSRAIMSLVVGVILIFLKTVAKPVLDAAGIPMS